MKKAIVYFTQCWLIIYITGILSSYEKNWKFIDSILIIIYVTNESNFCEKKTEIFLL